MTETSSRESAPLSRDLAKEAFEAIFETMFLAAFADDNFSDAEQAKFRSRVEELSDGEVKGERFDDMLATVTRLLFTDGTEGRIRSLSARLTNPSDRKQAIEAALRVAADDGLEPSERALVEQVAKALALPAQELDELIARHVSGK